MAIGSLTYKEQVEVLLKRSGVGPLFQDGMIVLREIREESQASTRCIFGNSDG